MLNSPIADYQLAVSVSDAAARSLGQFSTVS